MVFTVSEKKLRKEVDWLLRDKYGGKRTPAAERDIERLRNGEHISYVIGWAPFLGCRVDLSARPLIPRPETEHWTERIIEKMRERGTTAPRVLDIFCGSGCVGIAILKHLPKARVDLADIEDSYFTGIRKSLRLNKIDGRRARCIRSDVFGGLGLGRSKVKKYDLILANPPYIPSSGRTVAKAVLAQEPRRALFAGKDGLRYIHKVLREGKRHLNPDGMMVIEFDPPQKSAIALYARARGWQVEFHKDQYDRWRSASCYI